MIDPDLLFLLALASLVAVTILAAGALCGAFDNPTKD